MSAGPTGSRLVLGTMTFGAEVDRPVAAEIIDIAARAGVTMIDTANAYAKGESETILGELLTGRRDDFQLATKVGMPHPDAGDHAPLSPEAIDRCLEASLRRLATDHVDLYYLHQPDRSTPIAHTLRAMDRHLREGTVRAIGVSNYSAWQIAELRRVAGELSMEPPSISQPLYNLLARRIEAEYAEYTATAGVRNIVYNPLGGGLLTGKHRFDTIEQSGRFGDSALGPMYRQRYWNEQLFDAVEAIRRACEDHSVGMVETAFRWLLHRPAVGSVLVGASRTDHLRANLQAAQGGPLPGSLLDRLDEIWAALDGPAPAYNR
jgi:aryl-alcohol dehydrogenase-like predicted oxidoreductase